MIRTPVLKYSERFNDQSLPSLKDLTSTWDPTIKARVLEYLRSEDYAWAASTGSPLLDVFTGKKVPGLYGDFFMDEDGYCWRADLPYYVEMYDVGLPDEFVQIVLSK